MKYGHFDQNEECLKEMPDGDKCYSLTVVQDKETTDFWLVCGVCGYKLRPLVDGK